MADLKGFAQHGVDLTGKTLGNQAEAKCPFCRKVKMYINQENRLWDCKSCGTHGNYEQFLEQVAEHNAKKSDATTLKPLTEDRKLKARTLKMWKVGVNGVGYTYPAYRLDSKGARKVTDLRRYKIGHRPMSTKGGKVGLVMPKTWHGSKRIWICEGEWDAFAWSEVLWRQRIQEDVVGVCGAGNFPRDLIDVFAKKDVVLLFDNDEAGQRGMARTWKLLEPVVKSMKRLEWTENLPNGFDIRDAYEVEEFSAVKTLKVVKKGLTKEDPKAVLAGAPDTPEGRQVILGETDTGTPDPEGVGMHPEQVEAAYRKYLDLPDTEVLDVLFGAALANRLDSDPLWMFVIAPPGGSKSELLMSLSTAPLIHATTSLTPHALISGMQGQGGSDPSLIPKLDGKVLIVKDFTTILEMNMAARDEIFGILRDAYDQKIEKRFGNGLVRNYESKFGVIGGVTNYIDKQSNTKSILGERFIKYRIPIYGSINANKTTIMRALDNLTDKSNMREHLQAVGKTVLDRPIPKDAWPTIPRDIKLRLTELAQWIASMRGTVDRERYTNALTFKPTAEIGTRLATQLAILGSGIAIYQHKKEVDDRIYRILAKVACDTAPDRIEELIKQMYIRSQADEWVPTKDIVGWAGMGRTSAYLLKDMAMLSVVESRESRESQWRLKQAVRRKMDRLQLYTREKAWIMSD